jgi:hypothetical protein
VFKNSGNFKLRLSSITVISITATEVLTIRRTFSWWTQKSTSETSVPNATLRGATTHKTVVFIYAAMRTWNLKLFTLFTSVPYYHGTEAQPLPFRTAPDIFLVSCIKGSLFEMRQTWVCCIHSPSVALHDGTDRCQYRKSHPQEIARTYCYSLRFCCKLINVHFHGVLILTWVTETNVCLWNFLFCWYLFEIKYTIDNSIIRKANIC